MTVPRVQEVDVDDMLVGFEKERARRPGDGRAEGSAAADASPCARPRGGEDAAAAAAGGYDGLAAAASAHASALRAPADADEAERSVSGRHAAAAGALRRPSPPRQMRQPPVRWVPVSQDPGAVSLAEERNRGGADADDGLVPDTGPGYSSSQFFLDAQRHHHEWGDEAGGLWAKGIDLQAQWGAMSCGAEPMPLGLRLGISRTNSTLRQELLKAGFDLVD